MSNGNKQVLDHVVFTPNKCKFYARDLSDKQSWTFRTEGELLISTVLAWWQQHTYVASCSK